MFFNFFRTQELGALSYNDCKCTMVYYKMYTDLPIHSLLLVGDFVLIHGSLSRSDQNPGHLLASIQYKHQSCVIRDKCAVPQA